MWKSDRKTLPGITHHFIFKDFRSPDTRPNAGLPQLQHNAIIKWDNIKKSTATYGSGQHFIIDLNNDYWNFVERIDLIWALQYAHVAFPPFGTNQIQALCLFQASRFDITHPLTSGSVITRALVYHKLC
jgi:hypothetical protein